jgi:hypothetical protein
MSATVLGGPRIGAQPRVALREPEPSRWLVPAAVLATIVPIVVAVVRALADGWTAVGDNANFLVRSGDVLTAHHPLLGTWSSASLAIGKDVNHPGPLMFDLLAIPVKLGGSGGLAVGVALVAIASVIGIAVFGLRAGGPRLALGALVAAAGLAWTMGSTLLYDPWNPHVVLLPFLLLLVLVVAMAIGDALALPVAAGVGSVIVQTHLTYALLVPALCAVGLVLLVRHRRRAVVRPLAVTLVVVALAWAQPVADQLTGTGNLGTLAGGVGASEDTVGPALGARVAADVLATPPWWARPSFEDAYRVPPLQPTHVDGVPNVADLPSGATAAVALVALAGVLAASWLLARRRRDAVARTGLVIAGIGVVFGVAAVVTQPLSGVGITAHQLRYLWPIGVFATAMVLLAVTARRGALAAPLLAIVVLSVLNLPASSSSSGPANDTDVMPIVRELASQLDDLDVDEPLLYDTVGIRFAEPWTSAVMAALVERGIDFEVEEEFWVRQMGERRRADGDARERLFLREGEDAETVPDGARRVAHVDGIDADERRELESLKRELSHIDVQLNDAGRAAHALEPLPYFRDAEPDIADMVESGWLSVFVLGDLVTVPDDRRADVERYADLWNRWNRRTIALFIAPVDAEIDATG